MSILLRVSDIWGKVQLFISRIDLLLTNTYQKGDSAKHFKFAHKICRLANVT